VQHSSCLKTTQSGSSNHTLLRAKQSSITGTCGLCEPRKPPAAAAAHHDPHPSTRARPNHFPLRSPLKRPQEMAGSGCTLLPLQCGSMAATHPSYLVPRHAPTPLPLLDRPSPATTCANQHH
jgi:hypothetical protein